MVRAKIYHDKPWKLTNISETGRMPLSSVYSTASRCSAFWSDIPFFVREQSSFKHILVGGGYCPVYWKENIIGRINIWLKWHTYPQGIPVVKEDGLHITLIMSEVTTIVPDRSSQGAPTISEVGGYVTCSGKTLFDSLGKNQRCNRKRMSRRLGKMNVVLEWDGTGNKAEYFNEGKMTWSIFQELNEVV